MSDSLREGAEELVSSAHDPLPKGAGAILARQRRTSGWMLSAGAALVGIGVSGIVRHGDSAVYSVGAWMVGAMALWAGGRSWAQGRKIAAALREPPIPIRLTLSLRPVPEVGGEDLLATFRLLDPECVGHTGDEERVVVGTADGGTPPWLGETVDADAFAHPDTGEYILIRTPHGWLWGGPGEGDPPPDESPAPTESP